MPRGLVIFGIVAGVLVLGFFSMMVYILLASSDADYWEGEIIAFERRDISNPPAPGSVVFVGGRDIRFWESLEQDLAPIPVVRRGFGGAHLAHLTQYVNRVIKPYAPKAVVVMAGDADLADVHGRRPEDVLAEFKVFVSAVRAHNIHAPIYFISIKPSPMREVRWLGAKRSNDLIAAYCESQRRLSFIDGASAFIDEDGVINEELFGWDGLTLNEAGYKLLAARVRPVLMLDGLAP